MIASEFNGLKVEKQADKNSSGNGITTDELPRMLEMVVVFCATWSFGGSLSPEGRKTFDVALREMDGSIPSADTVFEYRIDFQKKQWVHWGDSVQKNWRPAPGVELFNSIVPTVDTLRSEFMLKTVILYANLQSARKRYAHNIAGDTNQYLSNYGTILFGPSGTGKTGIIKNILLPALEDGNMRNSVFSSY